MIPQTVQIPGWPYYLTINGEVFKDGSKKPRTPVKRGTGYWVTLYDKGRSERFRMNSLMRDLYFGGIDLPLVHLDGCKTNFAYWNLKPMPRSKIPTFTRKQGYKGMAVIETLPYGTENLYSSAAECGRAIHVCPSAVCRWCNGINKNTINENTYRWEDPGADKKGKDAV